MKFPDTTRTYDLFSEDFCSVHRSLQATAFARITRQDII